MKKTTTTRRPKGEGSITKLPNGNLKMTITLGIGADGKQKRKSVTAKTKAELLKRITEVRVMMGQKVEQSLYFKELFETFMKAKEDVFSEGTKSIYAVATPHVFAPLYDYRLDKITPAMIDDMLDGLRKRNGQKMSPTTIRNLKGKLSAVFNFATERDLLDKSPMKGTRDRSKALKRVNTVLIPSEEQIKVILQEAKKLDDGKDDGTIQLYPLFLLAVSTGLRIGEILDIDRDADIDLERNTIDINSQLTRNGGNKPLKTATSYRVIYVQPDILRTVLKIARKSDKTTKLWVSHDKQVTALAVGMKVHKFLRSSLNVPEGFTFHCFRHYHATQLLLKGINVKEVSKRLGHASIQTTLDIYAHWVPEMDETAANTVDTSLIF